MTTSLSLASRVISGASEIERREVPALYLGDLPEAQRAIFPRVVRDLRGMDVIQSAGTTQGAYHFAPIAELTRLHDHLISSWPRLSLVNTLPDPHDVRYSAFHA